MSRALQLAQRGNCTTHPNPRVGCVIVKNGQCIAEGWHQYAGGPHAEVAALTQAGSAAQGSTLYVSLEPCVHFGRTPPCVQALIAAKVERVVVAMPDPNPLVAGKGIAQLQAAGIAVESAVLAEQSARLNPGFISRMTRQRPYVRAKLAMSLDGRTAMASGESRWITTPAARQDVQYWRAQAAAVMTGSGTILQDNPRLNVRFQDWPALPEGTTLDLLQAHCHPVRVVVDSRLRVNASATLFEDQNPVWIFTGPQNPISFSLPSHGQVIPVATHQGRVDLSQVLRELARRDINEIFLEAGPTLSGAMLQAGWVDEIILYVAPKLMGHLAKPLFDLPLNLMDEAISLEIQQVRSIGKDLRLILRPSNVNSAPIDRVNP